MEKSKLAKVRRIMDLTFYILLVVLLFYLFIKISVSYLFPKSVLKELLEFDIQTLFSGMFFIIVATFLIEVIFKFIITIIEIVTDPSDKILKLLFNIKVSFLIILFCITIFDTDLFNIFVGILSIIALLTNLKFFYK